MKAPGTIFLLVSLAALAAGDTGEGLRGNAMKEDQAINAFDGVGIETDLKHSHGNRSSDMTESTLKPVHGNNANVIEAQRDMAEDDSSDLFVFPYKYNTKSNCRRKAERLRKRYDRKIKQWERFNPSCYTYTYEQICYRCPPPAEVTVVDGVVQSTVPELDDVPPTMEDLFSTLNGYMYDCSAGSIHQFRVKFGRQGLITALDMDETNELWDDEFTMYIRNFQTC